MTELEVKLIKLDGGTQARAGTDRDTVNEYVEVLRESDSTWPFPPVTVYYDGGAYWLADGFHRITAARQHGRFVCEADIRQGTQRDAILHAAGANADHGLRRTPEDKKRAVLRLLEDAEWGRWSDREIARTCKVSHPFVAKIRAETGNVTSERVYTDRHGNEAVMDTANIGSKPEKHWGLSNGMAFWREVEKLRIDKSRVLDFLQPGATHLTDLEMTKREAFDRLVYAPTEPVTPPQTAVTIPKMWEEWDTPVSPAEPSPFYVGPNAQGPEVREALERYLDQRPANRDFVIRCLASRESSRHNEMMEKAIAALGAGEMAIWHQAMVLKSNLPGPSWERNETAVAAPADPRPMPVWELEQLVRACMETDSYHRAGHNTPLEALNQTKEKSVGWRVVFDSIKATAPRLCNDGDLRQAINNVISRQGVLNSEQTAVSTPTMTAIMADVDAYEANTMQLLAPAPRRADYVDPRLADLNTAIGIVTRLTADTSLTIDTVGPLARALGLMEDAKKALANRQAYAAWLRDYQDDDGRRWTDLSDNQTWHKNSPCYQAFVKAFPKEDFARSALMDAKQRLEQEAAVSQEVSA